MNSLEDQRSGFYFASFMRNSSYESPQYSSLNIIKTKHYQKTAAISMTVSIDRKVVI